MDRHKCLLKIVAGEKNLNSSAECIYAIFSICAANAILNQPNSSGSPTLIIMVFLQLEPIRDFKSPLMVRFEQSWVIFFAATRR